MLRIILFLCLIGCATQSPNWLFIVKLDSSKAVFEPVGAYLYLLNTNTFASSHIGSSGSPSYEAIAFSTLLLDDYSEEAFLSLLESATKEGQLYALCGLYLANKDTFKVVVKPFLTDTSKVTTFWGCILGAEVVSSIVFDPKYVTKKKPNQTLDQWFEENFNGDFNSFESLERRDFDIVHGAWPNQLQSVEKSIYR